MLIEGKSEMLFIKMPRLGDLGDPVKHIELEPVEEPARREAPAPAPKPAPVPKTEPIPA